MLKVTIGIDPDTIPRECCKCRHIRKSGSTLICVVDPQSHVLAKSDDTCDDFSVSMLAASTDLITSYARRS